MSSSTRWEKSTVAFWITSGVHENCCIIIIIIIFFYFMPTAGSVALCFGPLSVSLGKGLLIRVAQTWSRSDWCQKWDSSAEAQWKAGPLWWAPRPDSPTIPSER